MGAVEPTDESRKMLPQSLDAIKERNSSDISVTGHTDRTGSAEINRQISMDRAKRIVEILISQGVDPQTIEIGYHGEVNPLVPTQDGVPESRNRRVEVTVR